MVLYNNGRFSITFHTQSFLFLIRPIIFHYLSQMNYKNFHQEELVTLRLETTLVALVLILERYLTTLLIA